MIAGLLGVAIGVFASFYPAQVPEDVYSYPFNTNGFTAIHIVFGLQHLGPMVGLSIAGWMLLFTALGWALYRTSKEG